MGYENVGRVWNRNNFPDYLSEIERPVWCKAITLHHTGSPSLADRPKGFLAHHIDNLKNFYQKEKGWSSGPHLFIDEDEIFGMTDLRKKGVHAVSFNNFAIGIEVLGNFNSELPDSDRGLSCWLTAAAATKALLDWLNLPATADTILFHRDDPTTKKSCPGSLVSKDWFIELIKQSSTGNNIEASPKPDIEWGQWSYQGGRWCVPVYDFLIARGVNENTVSSKLKSIAGEFFFGTEILEGAYYDKTTSRTWAPVSEILEIAQEEA